MGVSTVVGKLSNTSKLNEKGFTLMEILIVLSMIAILAAIAVPIYNQSLLKARETVLKENLYQVRDAIDKYYSDKGGYPSSLSTLVSERYIRELPLDPIENSKETWEEVYNDNGEGITDLKSSSDKVGRNGKPYSEW